MKVQLAKLKEEQEKSGKKIDHKVSRRAIYLKTKMELKHVIDRKTLRRLLLTGRPRKFISRVSGDEIF